MSNSAFLNIFSTFWQGLHGHDGPSADISPPGSTDTQCQSVGSFANVDGTPMLDNGLDVLGKVYGDSGPSFTDSHDIFGTGLHGSDW